MTKYEGTDRYLDKSGLLINLLGIGETKTLERMEASLAAWRSMQLFQSPLQGCFDLDHLKAIHKHLFGDVYAWAGELRDIDLAKGDSYFASHLRIAGAARPLFAKLAGEDHLKGLEPTAFSERAAYYLGEINALHPFREGNGRAQREFVSHLAYQNGLYIVWGGISQAEMIEASIESFHDADVSRFARFIRDNLRRREGLRTDHAAPCSPELHD